MFDQKDEFGNRMKNLESLYTSHAVPKEDILCVRIDGKAFSKFTKGCVKPFDDDLTKAMVETARLLVENTNASISYTQSDEITLLYRLKPEETGHIYSGKISKVNSLLASKATAFFNDVYKGDKLAFFDCRVWGVSSIEEASNVLLWRVQDCRKNSVSAAYRWVANEKITKKQPQMKQELLDNHGYDWNKERDAWKYGTFCKRVRYDNEDGISRSNIDPLVIGDYGTLSFEDRIQFILDDGRKVVD